MRGAGAVGLVLPGRRFDAVERELLLAGGRGPCEAQTARVAARVWSAMDSRGSRVMDAFPQGTVAVAVGLALLVWVDSGLAGFRAAVRRGPWPLPPGTVIRSILRGLAMGVETGMLCGLLLWGMVTTAPDGERLLLNAVDMGRALLAVYGSYAITVVVALGVRAMRQPGVDAFAEVLVRGPLLRSRPAVLVVGWFMGLCGADRRTALVSLVGCALALAFDPVLQWRQRADCPADRSAR